MEKALRSIIGISLVCVMAVIIAVAGIVGISAIIDSSESSNEIYTQSLADIGMILEYTQQLKSDMYDLVLSSGDTAAYQSAAANIEDRRKAFEEYLDIYSANIVNPETRMLFDEAANVYYNGYLPALMELMSRVSVGEDYNSLTGLVEAAKGSVNLMAVNYTECLLFTADAAREAGDANRNTAATVAVIIIILLVIEIVLSVIFIIAAKTGRHSQRQGSGAAYPLVNGKFPVYAMYPADPSNPVTPPNATHIMYPVIYPADPPRSGESRYYGGPDIK